MSISGEAPTIWFSPESNRYIYGDGLRARKYAIERERVDVDCWAAKLLTRHDLEDVAGVDVLAGTFDDCAVIGSR
jgi:hypothetical protein